MGDLPVNPESFNFLFLFPFKFGYCPMLLIRRKFLGFMIGLGLSFVGLNSCQTSMPTSPDTVVRVGILGSLTGDDADSGKALVDGANLAAERVNQAGGLSLGDDTLQVELVVDDTRSTPEGAVEAAQTLINQKGVVAIVGPQYSRYAIPVARLGGAGQSAHD
jgi:hypothetical protein